MSGRKILIHDETGQPRPWLAEWGTVFDGYTLVDEADYLAGDLKPVKAKEPKAAKEPKVAKGFPVAPEPEPEPEPEPDDTPEPEPESAQLELFEPKTSADLTAEVKTAASLAGLLHRRPRKAR